MDGLNIKFIGMKHPEIVKHIITENYRKGETDKEWTNKYEKLKKVVPLKNMGTFIDYMLKLNYKIDEINNVIKGML